MYQALLADVRFHELLPKIDHDMLKAARDEGCRCGGVLHSARYKRKPRGLPTVLSKQAYCWRLSLCCAVDGCRQRRTPPSLRFLGRQVYLATTVVLISTMLYGATPARVARLAQVCGADRRTIIRWREWWRTTFTDSRFWQAARATFTPPIDQNRLPASMLERFAGAVAGVTALPRADHWRGRHCARCMMVCADPQKTRLVNGDGVFYGRTLSMKAE